MSIGSEPSPEKPRFDFVASSSLAETGQDFSILSETGLGETVAEPGSSAGHTALASKKAACPGVIGPEIGEALRKLYS